MSHLGEIAHALALTLELFATAMTIGLGIGIPMGVARGARHRPVAFLAFTYSWFWRALPLLFLLYFGFYGLPLLGVSLSPITTAAVLIGLATSAYIGEIIYGGMKAIPADQWEGAAALGLSRLRTFLRVVLPQVARIVVGPLISQCILALKGTSLAGIVGVGELTGETEALINKTYTVWPYLLTAAAIYLVLSLVLSWLQRRAEVRWAW